MELAINQVLRLLAAGVLMESEITECEGVMHIQRVIPNVPINEFKRAETQGLEVTPNSFHGNEVQVQLRAKQLGTLEGLTWGETEDVSVTINIIPNNECSLGYEFAGVIQRLGPAVKKFHVSDVCSVLILSATGGIGIACIELARHRKAEDTSYESMIQEQYQNTIYAKVEGTWNLHNALKSCGSNLWTSSPYSQVPRVLQVV
ncbi:hypothetical protein BDV39DRAFT_206299 [Aspergillus sergii]|uniref:Uncharacterized protein n=1 Tax=Aspergillus sergii TaxID=1034303 RepID=A0A5N6X3K6_9EURO|nr:hypothetical protein BDV39DRAFT_206299 [Aspergillus sergii]